MHLNPVEYTIRVFGWPAEVARAAGLTPEAISKWKKTGTIPSAAQKKLILAARARGLDLTADDVIFGREVEQEGA